MQTSQLDIVSEKSKSSRKKKISITNDSPFRKQMLITQEYN